MQFGAIRCYDLLSGRGSLQPCFTYRSRTVASVWQSLCNLLSNLRKLTHPKWGSWGTGGTHSCYARRPRKMNSLMSMHTYYSAQNQMCSTDCHPWTDESVSLSSKKHAFVAQYINCTCSTRWRTLFVTGMYWTGQQPHPQGSCPPL